MEQFIVEHRLPLLETLAQRFPDSSKSTLRSWVKEGRIVVDDVPAKRSDRVVEKGQKISLREKQHLIEGRIPIVYQDAHFVVIDKPHGLLSVATAFDKTETAHALLKKHYHPRKIYVVHRLDQDTSGIMLFALSEEGYEGLKQLFEKHDIDRCYYAIVEGRPEANSGTWQSYLYEDSRYVVHTTENRAEGTLAITHYEVEKASPRYTLVKLRLETGRKHQIRVHCSESGCPVVGDKKYGAATDPLHRLCLHAATLGFDHPVTGKKMRFSSPIPATFHAILRCTTT